ncbi:MAG: helix-turn-helix transcriptional regulator [Lachnospiraceae bacterium]
MNNLGIKIATVRKNIGMTQIEFAEKLSVTRQTVSRWESGSVMPDLDKIPDIASILGVSCDYLLKDENGIQEKPAEKSVSSLPGRLLKDIRGKKVKLDFCDDEADVDLFGKVITVEDFEGNWMKVTAETPKGEMIEKIIPLSSVLSFEIMKEN